MMVHVILVSYFSLKIKLIVLKICALYHLKLHFDCSTHKPSIDWPSLDINWGNEHVNLLLAEYF